jgi:hypothetical protein
MTLITVLRIASVIAALILGALIVYAGEPNHLQWWIGALPFALWVIGPAVAPCLLANNRSPHWFSITTFLYFGVSTVLSGVAYYEAFFRSKSSTAALTLVFIPLYQWLGIALLLLLRLGIRRGRPYMERWGLRAR